MTTSVQPNRYQMINVVADGEGYILGRNGTTEFVAVPELGGQIVQWLQGGVSVADCATRAGDVAGQEVDVADFLADLETPGS
jgi:putative peptide zinc metalloprotease protein